MKWWKVGRWEGHYGIGLKSIPKIININKSIVVAQGHHIAHLVNLFHQVAEFTQL